MKLKSAISALAYLAKSYSTALPRIIYRTSLSLFLDPSGTQTFVHQVLNALDLEKDDLVLGSTDIEDLVVGGGDSRIVGPYYARRTGGTGSLLELACLGYLLQNLHPQLVFEMGTFVGRTTRVLALNSPPDCQLVTLDLPAEQVKHDIGMNYRRKSEASRVQQVYGDSRTFDFTPWYGQCDFVWVDACHDYEYVVSDTQNALKLCRPGGWIGWHDYRHTAWWSGVTRAVRELHREYPRVRHIRGTTIALLEKVNA